MGGELNQSPLGQWGAGDRVRGPGPAARGPGGAASGHRLRL